MIARSMGGRGWLAAGAVTAVLAFPSVAAAQCADLPYVFAAGLSPAQQTVASGATATLVAATAEFPGCIDYFWYEGARGDHSHLLQSGTGKSGYTTPPLTTSTTYWVRACYVPFPTGNPQCADTNAAAVLVAAPARILTQPRGYVITPGRTAMLSVEAIGPNPQTCQWYLGMSGDMSGPIDGATDCSYATPPLASATAYWVRVSNPYGSTDSDAATIVVAAGLTPGDFDGDGKGDPTIYRPSTGLWAILKSGAGYTSSTTVSWGLSTDVPVPGDYDGDGKIDPTIYRPSTGLWAILKSSTNYTTSRTVSWGLSTDLPVQGDFDGDGRTDPAIYRPSTALWAVLKSSTDYFTSVRVSFGNSTDVPVPGDYDGDGWTDPALFRPSTGGWLALKSTQGYTSSLVVSWGLSTDIPAPADYDGDRRIDPAIFRPSTGLWALLQSSTNHTSSHLVSWGLGTDVPINRKP